MKSNHFLEELEQFIDQLNTGKKIDTNLDPEAQKIIREVYTQIQTTRSSQEFRTQLLEKIRERISTIEQPETELQLSFMEKFQNFISSWKRGFGFALVGVFAIALLVNLSPEWKEKGIDGLPLIPSGTLESTGIIEERGEETEKNIVKKEDLGDLTFSVPSTARDSVPGSTRKPPSSHLLQDADRPQDAVSGNKITWMNLGNSGEAVPPSESDITWTDYSDHYYEPPVHSRENYQKLQENHFEKVAETPVSTFSIDVDTGAYANVRRFLKNGQLPPQAAVRVEEMINYFDYDYTAPDNTETPFATHTEIATTPWNQNTRLLHIGIKGYERPQNDLPSSNLVFLIDVSGSMNDTNKLPLLKQSLSLLTKSLREQDRISLVVYAGSSGLVLDGASGESRAEIETAIARLSSGGSTHGSAGIKLAYETAEKHFIKGGINRILLATDGDFNVGTTNFDDLIRMIEEKRKNDVALSTFGFGTGNFNDHLMEQLADAGNGNYSYIDSLLEAQKVLVNERGSTLDTIAKDVKIQIEFNPAVVTEYRLIGYENRALNREDFNNDQIDAGEIGAGHTVTALYEVALVGADGITADPLRYQEAEEKITPKNFEEESELAFLKMRFKYPDEDVSQLREFPIANPVLPANVAERRAISENFRFSAAVAAFGQKLRGGSYLNGYSYDEIKDLANSAKGDDEYGYRAEMIGLIDLAKNLAR